MSRSAQVPGRIDSSTARSKKTTMIDAAELPFPGPEPGPAPEPLPEPSEPSEPPEPVGPDVPQAAGVWLVPDVRG